MFPFIPMLAGLCVAGGGGTLLWYESLSKEDKARSNKLAAEYAEKLFKKTVSQLTAGEAQIVRDRLKAQFMN